MPFFNPTQSNDFNGGPITNYKKLKENKVVDPVLFDKHTLIEGIFTPFRLFQKARPPEHQPLFVFLYRAFF